MIGIETRPEKTKPICPAGLGRTGTLAYSAKQSRIAEGSSCETKPNPGGMGKAGGGGRTGVVFLEWAVYRW